jgi:hypothetical protein
LAVAVNTSAPLPPLTSTVSVPAPPFYARTEGNPLFLADLLGYLSERGVIAEQPGDWELVRPAPEFQRELPELVRALIQKKLAQPDERDRRLLAAASVQGQEFDSAVVARVLGRDPAEVEGRLEALDRVHGLVRLRREQEFPDGTLSLRYQFVHSLYQNALFAGLQPTRRKAWSAAAAQALLHHHGGQGRARPASWRSSSRRPGTPSAPPTTSGTPPRTPSASSPTRRRSRSRAGAWASSRTCRTPARGPCWSCGCR